MYSTLQYLLELTYIGEPLPELPYDGVHVGLRYFVAFKDEFYSSADILLEINSAELLPAQIEKLRSQINNGDVIVLNDIVHGLSKFLVLFLPKDIYMAIVLFVIISKTQKLGDLRYRVSELSTAVTFTNGC